MLKFDMKDYLGEGEYATFFDCEAKRELKSLNIFTALYVSQNYTKLGNAPAFHAVSKLPSFQHNKQQLLKDLSSGSFRI